VSGFGTPPSRPQPPQPTPVRQSSLAADRLEPAAPPPPPEPIYSVAEVADRLRVSKMTVYRLVHAGELSAHRFGRSFRITQRGLDAYLTGSVNFHPGAEP
jgi:excisionase family DNA binding protein